MEPQFAKLVRIDKKKHLQLRLSRTLRPKATVCEILNLLQLDYQIFRSVCHKPDCPHCEHLLHAARDLEVSVGRQQMQKQIKEDEKLREHLKLWQAQIPEIKSATPEQVKRIGQSLIQPPFLEFKLQKLDWIHKRFEKQKSDMVDGCPVCYEPYNRCFISFQCSHLLCWDCLVKLVQAQYNRKEAKVRCPLCNMPVLGKTSEAIDTVAPVIPPDEEEEEELTQPYSPEPEFSLPPIENDSSLFLTKLLVEFHTLDRPDPIYFSAFDNSLRIIKFREILDHPILSNSFNLNVPDHVNALDLLEILKNDCLNLCVQKLSFAPFHYMRYHEFCDLFVPLRSKFKDDNQFSLAMLGYYHNPRIII